LRIRSARNQSKKQNTQRTLLDRHRWRPGCAALFAADRALSLGERRLRGHLAPEVAPVVPLPLRMSG